MQTLLLLLLKTYRYLLSPYVGMHCRFEPSCSCYATTAVEQYGAVKGVGLAIKRLGRCHPWAQGGFDPVPHDDGHRCVQHGPTEA
ncbi:MAG TPA: membrane protein insertion efficiency factor YidD [Chromatiaceae bacterium]|nr:membrane protein insertion efficiency factor YidD [Chromatiaceae bacterium]